MKRKILKDATKLPIVGGGIYGCYTFYKNRIRSAPPRCNIHEKDQKQIAIVGGGIVGLSQAYYLSLYPENSITIIEKEKKMGQITSLQNGNFMMRYWCAPWTWKPITFVLKGLYKQDHPMIIKPIKALREPGQIKFVYYWL